MKMKRLAAIMAAAMMACSMICASSVTASAATEEVVIAIDEEERSENIRTEGWVYVGEDTYYILPDGSFKTGWMTTKTDSKYYFGKTGKMVVNKWVTFKNGNKYYFGDNGKMYSSKWLILENGQKRYFRESGKLATSCTLKIDGHTFKFDKKGKVTKIVPRQDVYVAADTGVYHYDEDCCGDTCYSTTLAQIKDKGFTKCKDCVKIIYD